MQRRFCRTQKPAAPASGRRRLAPRARAHDQTKPVKDIKVETKVVELDDFEEEVEEKVEKKAKKTTKKATKKEETKEEVVEEEKPKKATKKEEKVDYSKMTVAELKKIAKEKGISGYSTMKKDELVSSLN